MENTEVGLDRTGGAQGSGAAEPLAAVKDMAGAAGRTIKEEAASFASVAQDKVSEQVEQHKSTAAKAIGDFATAIQHAGDELASNDQSLIGGVIKQAADHLGELAHTVADKRPEELLQTLRDFGRRNPAAFAAVSVLAGLAIGRLVRASAKPDDEEASFGADGSFRADGAPSPTSSLPGVPAAATTPLMSEPFGDGGGQGSGETAFFDPDTTTPADASAGQTPFGRSGGVTDER